MDIRLAIHHNIKGQNATGFRDIIEDAINVGEEKTLPGLGVFFEVFWKKADANLQKQVLEILVSQSK